jgi:hypothetical protein
MNKELRNDAKYIYAIKTYRDRFAYAKGKKVAALGPKGTLKIYK